jgi:MoaA/NifB/PqqE/SkfB family radical SAM enzyme
MQPASGERQKGLNSIHIEIAKNVCNIRCKFCYIDFSPKTDRYDYSGLRKVVDYCRRYHVPYITIQGGEITAIPQGYKFCAELAELGCSFNVMTNGVRINENWIRLFATSCHRINISINTPSPETYDEICGADWHEVYSNIQKVNALRRESSRACELSISMVIVKQNFHQIVDFYRLSRELGVDYIVLFPDISSPQKADMNDPANLVIARKSYEELRDLMNVAGAIHPENWVALKILRDFAGYKESSNKPAPSSTRVLKTANAPVPAAASPKPYCLMPSQMVYIDHGLNVYTCCGTTGIPYGNLKTADLETIIRNPKRQLLQDRISKYDYSACSKYCTLMPR